MDRKSSVIDGTSNHNVFSRGNAISGAHKWEQSISKSTNKYRYYQQENKKAVLSIAKITLLNNVQVYLQHSRSRSWAVVEIYDRLRLRRYCHLKFFQYGGGRHLEFVWTVNSAVRSAVPENPTLEPNTKWIGLAVAEIWPFAYVGAYGTPILGEGEVVGGQRSYH